MIATLTAQTLMRDSASSTGQLITSAYPIYLIVLGLCIAGVFITLLLLTWKFIYKLIKRMFKL